MKLKCNSYKSSCGSLQLLQITGKVTRKDTGTWVPGTISIADGTSIVNLTDHTLRCYNPTNMPWTALDDIGSSSRVTTGTLFLAPVLKGCHYTDKFKFAIEIETRVIVIMQEPSNPYLSVHTPEYQSCLDSLCAKENVILIHVSSNPNWKGGLPYLVPTVSKPYIQGAVDFHLGYMHTNQHTHFSFRILNVQRPLMNIEGNPKFSVTDKSLTYKIPYKGNSCEIKVRIVLEACGVLEIQSKNEIQPILSLDPILSCESLFDCARVLQSKEIDVHSQLHKRMQRWRPLHPNVMKQIENAYVNLMRGRTGNTQDSRLIPSSPIALTRYITE